jgi:ATP-dependent DNA helicase PIF1
MNEEQQSAYDAVLAGDNVFITGAAGTGKSYVLKRIIRKFRNKKIGITATTGSAALLISGKTIHSFLGIGLATKCIDALVAGIFVKRKDIVKKLQKLDLIIIDEVSMMDDELFEKVVGVIEKIRGGKKLQYVLCGDFCQLPPVKGKYCFTSPVWKDLNIITCMLRQVIRQKDDQEFREILESLRWGRCTPSIIARLESLRNTAFPEGLKPTVMYGKNVDVDAINTKELEILKKEGAEQRSFKTSYSSPSAMAWAQSCKVHENIELCVGAQVVMTWNTDKLVNGSRGVIIGFDNIMGTVQVKFAREDEIITVGNITVTSEDNDALSMSFMPLKLAWAITHYRSQGMTLDCCIIDLESWTYGQAYTALSRVRDLKSLRVIGRVSSTFFRAHPLVLEFYGIT